MCVPDCLSHRRKEPNNTFEERSTPNITSNTRGYHYPTFGADHLDSVRCDCDNKAHAAAKIVLKLKAGDTLEFVAAIAELEK
jgi:hypothetical protein